MVAEELIELGCLSCVHFSFLGSGAEGLASLRLDAGAVAAARILDKTFLINPLEPFSVGNLGVS